jgi:hypothetical protein
MFTAWALQEMSDRSALDWSPLEDEERRGSTLTAAAFMGGGGALTRRDGRPTSQLQMRYTPRPCRPPKRLPAAIHPPRAAQLAPKGGAGDGTRTRDIQLGKLTLYQLSYSRVRRAASPHAPSGREHSRALAGWEGAERITHPGAEPAVPRSVPPLSPHRRRAPTAGPRPRQRRPGGARHGAPARSPGRTPRARQARLQ